MSNNNGYGVELTTSMAQNTHNTTPANYSRYQLANGQFVSTMNTAPMFATVDVAGGYNALGTAATYQQYYPFQPTMYNPEIFQNQLAFAAMPGAVAYNAPPPAAFSRPPPHLPTAQSQMVGGNTGQQQQGVYNNQTGDHANQQNVNQYFTNAQNTGSQPSSRFSTNNKVKQLSLFDNSSENYTASWVSSTSSIPPDLKVSPDHNSNPTSPHNEFAGNWTNEQANATGTHAQLQHSSSVDEFAAGASATSGFSPPVDQSLSNINIANNAAYNSFPSQVQQIQTMNRSPGGQNYFTNASGQSAYFPTSGTGQMVTSLTLKDFPHGLGKQIENAIQQQATMSGNTNTGVTGGTSNTASWANVVKRSGNCSVGETRIRTVITEPQPQNLAQNQNTGISDNGNDRRSAGAVGDNRIRNNRNSSRYQGNSRNYNQNRNLETNNPQANNTFNQRNNQNGGSRYSNNQTQGNQYQNQRKISSPRGGNNRNESNAMDTNKVKPLNATQVPPPNNLNHFTPQQATSSPNILPNMMAAPAPIANFYMPPNSAATGFSSHTMQQPRNYQAAQWNPNTPVPLAAIPAQQFMSRPSPPVHNGPQQPTFSGMPQPFPQQASGPPGMLTPLYGGNNQQLGPQKGNFKGTWLDQDTVPKDQVLINYEMGMFVQSHNQNIAGWRTAKMTAPNNPVFKTFSPPQGGLLYVILGSGNFPPRYGSPQQNPRLRRFRALHSQQAHRGKGGSPLKASKKKSTDSQPSEDNILNQDGEVEEKLDGDKNIKVEVEEEDVVREKNEEDGIEMIENKLADVELDGKDNN